jgi:NitT/TauT family transport system permease protein
MENENIITKPIETPIADTAPKVVKNTVNKYFAPIAKLFTPNKRVDNTTTWTILVMWIVGTLLIWTTSDSHLLPSPLALLEGGRRMFVEYDLTRDLLTSLFLVMKAMIYAILICYALATISTLEFFRPIANFFSKSRFVTTVGLSVLFVQITPDTTSQKTALLVFSVTVFLVTSFLSIIMDIKKDEYDYAKTLKMSNWKAFYEIIILGKSDLFIDAIRQNFAIAWMMLPLVENFCRVDGGIGIVLTDQNKYFHMDAVYAIQIVVLFMGICLDWFFGFIKGIVRPDTLLTLNRK